MTDVINILTLNVNNISSPRKVKLLSQCLRNMDIQIGLLQEVGTSELHNIFGYNIESNVLPDERGTAVVIQDHIPYKDVIKLPDGRGIALRVENIHIVNVYAPSGSQKRRERQKFLRLI